MTKLINVEIRKINGLKQNRQKKSKYLSHNKQIVKCFFCDKPLFRLNDKNLYQAFGYIHICDKCFDSEHYFLERNELQSILVEKVKHQGLRIATLKLNATQFEVFYQYADALKQLHQHDPNKAVFSQEKKKELINLFKEVEISLKTDQNILKNFVKNKRYMKLEDLMYYRD